MHEKSGESPAIAGRNSLLLSWLRESSLDPDGTAAAAAQSVLRHQFAICMSKVAGTRAGEDPEELHEMRVAIRRMRAALKLFVDHVSPAIADLAIELKWLGGVLGPVRDLDVQLEQIDAWRRVFDEGEGEQLDVIEERVRHRWMVERRIMNEALESSRYRALVDLVTDTLEAEVEGVDPIQVVARSLVRRQKQRVRKLGDKIDADTPAEVYHRLRVRMKALRYALEFHRTLYGKATTRGIRDLKKLQDILGEHQDADVAREHLRELVTDDLPPQTAYVLGVFDERYRQLAAELRGRFPRAYRRLFGDGWQQLEAKMKQVAKRVDS